MAVYSSAETQHILLTTGLVLGTIIMLTVILIVTIVLALFFRKSAQQKMEFDSSLPFAGEQLKNYSHNHIIILTTSMIRYNWTNRGDL